MDSTVNNNLQRMHLLYIYYISQHSYMFRSIWTILREYTVKRSNVKIVLPEDGPNGPKHVGVLRYVINIQ
jgi:hypothetical protein